MGKTGNSLNRLRRMVYYWWLDWNVNAYHYRFDVYGRTAFLRRKKRLSNDEIDCISEQLQGEHFEDESRKHNC